VISDFLGSDSRSVRIASDARARIIFIFSALEGRPFFLAGLSGAGSSCVIVFTGATRLAATERTLGRGLIGPLGRIIGEAEGLVSRSDGGGGPRGLTDGKTDILTKE
jgi:hypothetical protein